LYCNHAESGWYREEIPFAPAYVCRSEGFLIYERNSSELKLIFLFVDVKNNNDKDDEGKKMYLIVTESRGW